MVQVDNKRHPDLLLDEGTESLLLRCAQVLEIVCSNTRLMQHLNALAPFKTQTAEVTVRVGWVAYT